MKSSRLQKTVAFALFLATALTLTAARKGAKKAARHKVVTKAPVASAPAAPAPPAGTARFQIYLSPPGVADDSGEPSIGSNWTKEAINHNTNLNLTTNNIANGGTSLYFGGFSPAMTKVTWDDCSSPAGTLWENKPLLSASTPRAAGDPILFTDSEFGRTFVAQLEGLTPAGATIDITDDDGDTFIPSDGVVPSDIDHETIGGGQYNPNAVPPPPPHPAYPNAIYYASQSVTDARALRSDNGGLVFSPAAAPMFTVADCAGLHGHLKVSPADGTVYVPDFACGGNGALHNGGKQGLAVSVDNGETWTVHTIPDSSTSGVIQTPVTPDGPQTRDPAVAVGTDGTVYFAYQAADGKSMVAVSQDKGVTWAPSVDLGASVINGGPVLVGTFQAATAGDGDRAAVAFLGTETGGDNWDCGQGNTCSSPRTDFTGTWYLYVSVTYDRGQTWTTQNVTPGDPVQRGGICGGGTCRNLLDFMDARTDKEGRILVGYPDGCISAGCIAGDKNNDGKVDGNDNDFTAKGGIARQSGGKRLFAALDSSTVEPAVPGAPMVTATFGAGNVVNLTWPVPDNGGSAILGYHVYRKNGAGPFTLIATTTVNNFTDATPPSETNMYHVTAFNDQGDGPYCTDVTPAVVVLPDICKLPGALADNDLNADGSDNDGGQNTPPPDVGMNIKQLFVAEPFLGTGVNAVEFTFVVDPNATGTPAPNSEWYIIWNRVHTDNNTNFDRWYVRMKTDAAGATSFDYGMFSVALNPTDPNIGANQPTSIGAADSGSYDPTAGIIRIVLKDSKLDTAGGLSAGQALTMIDTRTYFGSQGTPTRTQTTANDIALNGAYTLSGNCAPPTVPVLSVVSALTHGSSTGEFDIPLPYTGHTADKGIECRKSDTYQVIFTFVNPLSSVGSLDHTGNLTIDNAHTGINSSNPVEYIVTMTGVDDMQAITLTLNNIADTAGNTTTSLTATMNLLVGDVNASTVVDGNDVSDVQGHTRQRVDKTNFVYDVNLSGLIDGNDVSTVQGLTRSMMRPH